MIASCFFFLTLFGLLYVYLLEDYRLLFFLFHSFLFRGRDDLLFSFAEFPEQILEFPE
jgi:hypothetical protein